MSRLEEENQTIQKLVDECWAKIFNHLTDDYDWISLSLTCKKFLSLSNSSRISLFLYGIQNAHLLRRLFERFPNLRKLTIGYLEDLDDNINLAIQVLPQFNLNIYDLDLSFDGSFRTVWLDNLGSRFKLKVLKLSCIVTNAHLIRIADTFPLLEEIRTRDNSMSSLVAAGEAVNDEGIHYLSSKLKRLRTVDISHNYISDKSLVSFASNCVFLEHFMVRDCDGKVTDNGVSSLVKNCSRLKSLLVNGSCQMERFGGEHYVSVPKSLQILELEYLGISDEFLYSITKARISLTHFHLVFCQGYSFSGIWKLLNSYRSLKTLVLCGAEFLTYEHIDKLSPFLHNLTTIQLSNCPLLSDLTFVILTQRCPLLCHISMNGTTIGKEEYEYDDLNLKKNFAVKFLNLSTNYFLSTSTLCRLLSICPKVEKLILGQPYKSNVQQIDVGDVLEGSKELLKLDLRHCHLKFTRKNIEFSTIEKLDATSSDINDEVLVDLAKICPKLLHLKMANCEDVTDKGVKEVVKSCKRLRSLDIHACKNVDSGILDWIQSNYPSMTRRVWI